MQNNKLQNNPQRPKKKTQGLKVPHRPLSTQVIPQKYKESFKKCDNLNIPPACRDRFDCARFNQCIRACTQSGSTALKGCNSLPRLHCMDKICSQDPPVKSCMKNCRR